MTLSKLEVKSCCGSSSKSLVVESDKPIRKYQVKTFRDAGYFIPDSFFEVGVFYVQKGGLIANASFGSKRFNVRSSGPQADVELAEFEAILESAINT